MLWLLVDPATAGFGQLVDKADAAQLARKASRKLSVAGYGQYAVVKLPELTDELSGLLELGKQRGLVIKAFDANTHRSQLLPFLSGLQAINLDGAKGNDALV